MKKETVDEARAGVWAAWAPARGRGVGKTQWGDNQPSLAI